MPAITPAKFHGLITIDAASNNATFKQGANPDRVIAVPLTDYYIRDAVAVSSLVATVQAQLTGFPEFAAFTATVSDAGIVTLTNGASFTTTWDDTRLRDILGYTGDLTPAATSFVAPRQHMYGWYPNVAASMYDGATGAATLVAGLPSADTTVRRAVDGSTYSLRFASYDDRQFVFRAVDDERVFAVGTDPNIALSQFYGDVLSRGIRWRFFPDRTVNGTFKTYVADQKTARDMFAKVEYENATWARLFKLVFDAHAYVGTFP